MSMEAGRISINDALAQGVKLLHSGGYREAETLFRGVLMHEPEHPVAIRNLSCALVEQEDLYEALYWALRAKKLDRRNALSLTNLGLIWSQLGHPDEGLPELERATVIADRDAPRHIRAMVWNNFGNTLERVGRYREALTALDSGIKNNPSDPFPRYNRGIVLIRLGRHQEGIASLDKALELYGPNANPREIADCRYNRGLACLALGNISEGFEDFEYRLLTTGQGINHGFPEEMKWDGSPLGDTPLLILAEWGLGDTIQFLRFIPEVLRRAPNLTLAVQSVLGEMVKECWPEVKLIPAKTVIGHKDMGKWAAVMSLAHLCGVRKEADIPLPWHPHIGARILPPTDCMRIGVCWAGNPKHKNDRNRSIPLEVFGQLFKLPYEFISLQRVREEEKPIFAELQAMQPNVRSFDLTDLRDTATLIGNCNLVISADTAVAHLAASIGVPTWILIPAVNVDWRWQLKGTKTAWYPNATLWRGNKAAEWRDVINAMADKLRLTTEEAA
jgi:tetratricopeptide (TPR) repeat protein